MGSAPLTANSENEATASKGQLLRFAQSSKRLRGSLHICKQAGSGFSWGFVAKASTFRCKPTWERDITPRGVSTCTAPVSGLAEGSREGSYQLVQF